LPAEGAELDIVVRLFGSEGRKDIRGRVRAVGQRVLLALKLLVGKDALLGFGLLLGLVNYGRSWQ
jgi:hypothetical protein